MTRSTVPLVNIVLLILGPETFNSVRLHGLNV